MLVTLIGDNARGLPPHATQKMIKTRESNTALWHSAPNPTLLGDMPALPERTWRKHVVVHHMPSPSERRQLAIEAAFLARIGARANATGQAPGSHDTDSYAYAPRHVSPGSHVSPGCFAPPGSSAAGNPFWSARPQPPAGPRAPLFAPAPPAEPAQRASLQAPLAKASPQEQQHLRPATATPGATLFVAA